MKTILSVILISLVLTGCNFSRSVKKDLIAGLTTTGKDLTCDDIYITVNGERTTRNSFIYGEVFYLNLNDVKGFTKENGNVFPGMEMNIVNQKGDTVFQTVDLYSGYREGMNYSPLLLTADLTIAAPIKSKDNYIQIVNVWDKKGKGKFISKFDFKVVENDKIMVESSGVSHDEIYIFSQGKNTVITDGRIEPDDNIYIISEGLKGFKDENGLVYPGLSLEATDSGNNQVFNYDDLFTDYTGTGVGVSDFATRVSSHFKIAGGSVSNPLHCRMTVWDKKSDARITITTDLSLN
jgi:hypothetical protein